MADLYADYADLAANEVEGVDYTRTIDRPEGSSWASIAIHGGGIEAGSGEMARRVAELRRMAFYEFAGIQASDNFADLHITSTNFDEPLCLDLVAAVDRVLSWHGYAGTVGVAETAIGGLDGELRDLVAAALTAAGFTVIAAGEEIAGTNTANICNKSRRGAGVQLELSRAQREAFFPGGDLSRAMRESGQRTVAFEAYAQAVATVLLPALTYDPQLSRVRLTSQVPGLVDTFTGRTVVDDWGDAESGQVWLRSGAASAFQVTGGVGQHIHTAANVSRWSLAAVNQADWDVIGSVATDRLAAGGGQFHALVGRSSDDGATCYLARLEFSTSQTVILTLRRRVSDTETFLVQHTVPGLTHTIGGRVAWRFQGVGSTLRAKAWLASDPQPADWQLETTDTNVTGRGRIGTRSILSSAYSGTLPVTSSWDDITAQGRAVVERSTNGVQWLAVRGGVDLPGDGGGQVRLDDYEFADAIANLYRVRVIEPVSGATLWVEQDQITPALAAVWLKSLSRPFLNRQVVVRDFSDVERPNRAGVFEIIGRSLPVAISDVRGSRRWTLELTTETRQEGDNLDLLLASGDILFVHVPAAGRLSATPGGYVLVGDTRQFTPPTVDLAMQVWVLPCVEVAAPGPDVVGATSTWQTVLSAYPTWQDVLDAHLTWESLLELIGDPTDVIVP